MSKQRLFWIGLPLAAAFAVAPSCSPDEVAPATPAGFVGRQTCTECHQDEHDTWHGSHHDLAMQEATEDSVLGDFDDSTFDHFGTVSKFYRDGERFMVKTDGPDGKLTDYEVKYVFGVYPLQQFLIPFPKGRMQALGIAWDSRPKEQGGQRWFHLYQEKIAHDDILHWTGRAQNWNHMCANCHSTNLRKNYDVATDAYQTSWSEIDVSCEACHGPASHHLEWSKNQALRYPNKGFALSLRNDSTWVFEPGKTTAVQRGGTNAKQVTAACARCHARRTTIDEDFAPRGVHDTELVSLLEPLNYHQDGQIKDEVYVYGSFVQSKMHHAGVTCTDCHDPHTLKPLAPGNTLCIRCHDATAFDTRDHHHHEPGTPGAQCVHCHMPVKKYMVVDPRLDHSIRIPRPDLSVQIGTPNACNRCHQDKRAKWAAEAIAKWRPEYEPRPHFGSLLHVAQPGMDQDQVLGARLAAMIEDPAVPPIARATGLVRLTSHLDRGTLATVAKAAKDEDPLVRRGALDALAAAPASVRIEIAGPLLRDEVRSVRTAAARTLAGASEAADDDSATTFPPELRPALESALAEYEAFQRINADQPWAHVNLGIVRSQTGQLEAAEASYRQALKIDDRWVQAYVNLADLLRTRGRHEESERTLLDGLNRIPDSADLNHAFGLALHRNGKTSRAIKALGHAARLRPEAARYGYAYGVALHSTGKFALAIDTLERTHRRHPRHFDTLYALASFHARARKLEPARRWTKKLYELAPQHPDVQALVKSLR